VPEKKLAVLGTSKPPKVKVTVNGDYSFVTTVASRGGKYLTAFSKARREESGLSAGDPIEVTLSEA
jgi:hypothetical protein